MTKTKDLAKYIITVTEKSPKKFRFTLVVRMQNYILDAIENIYLANSQPIGAERLSLQKKASKSFDKKATLDSYRGYLNRGMVYKLLVKVEKGLGFT